MKISLNDVQKNKLDATINECEKHLNWMQNAHDHIKHLFPMTIVGYNNLNSDDVPFIDQYLYRFTKLQDTIGSRLFNIILSVLAEEPKNMSFIDILNRLEQLSILEDKEVWLDLRVLRNQASHEYDDKQNMDVLNKLFASEKILINIYTSAKNFIEKINNI